MKVQFFAPHPDDVELFCGGTFLRHYHSKDIIQVYLMTRGGYGTINPWQRGKSFEAMRTREAEARYRLVPEVEIHWVDFEDGEVHCDESAVTLLQSQISAFAPDLIYLPETTPSLSFYWHQDHLQTGKIVELAVKREGLKTHLRHYHSRKGNCFVNIDSFYESNHHALRLYATQYSPLANPPFALHGLEAIRNFCLRLWGRKIHCRHAEWFRESSMPSQVALQLVN